MLRCIKSQYHRRMQVKEHICFGNEDVAGRMSWEVSSRFGKFGDPLLKETTTYKNKQIAHMFLECSYIFPSCKKQGVQLLPANGVGFIIQGMEVGFWSLKRHFESNNFRKMWTCQFEAHDILNLDPPASVMFEPCLVLEASWCMWYMSFVGLVIGISKSETTFCLKCWNVAPIGSI